MTVGTRFPPGGETILCRVHFVVSESVKALCLNDAMKVEMIWMRKVLISILCLAVTLFLLSGILLARGGGAGNMGRYSSFGAGGLNNFPAAGAGGLNSFPSSAAGGWNSFGPKGPSGNPRPPVYPPYYGPGQPYPYIYYSNYAYGGIPGMTNSVNLDYYDAPAPSYQTTTTAPTQATNYGTAAPELFEIHGSAVPAGNFFFLKFKQNDQEVAMKILLNDQTRMNPPAYKIQLGDKLKVRYYKKGLDYIAQTVEKEL